jgi:serine/threonine protein kinase
MPLEVGEVFAGYTIVRVLGAGGMGKVYLASHPRLPRQDALKVVPADLSADPEFRGRFLQEAELAAGLSHPHIVAVHDRGEDEGHFWISMDYVAGTDASQLLRDQYPAGMPVDEALQIITAVAMALDYAHHRGLLHRDVKPANILLTEPEAHERRIFLADFGIARRIEDTAGLTATNTTVGTAAYAPPEQLKGEAIDGRADQYALACTAFHLLTGAPPYDHSNPAVVITQHVIAPAPSIGARRPELAAMDWVFASAMAKNPSGRFGSCAEFAGQLRRSLSPGSAPRRPDVPFPQSSPLGVAAPTLPPLTAPPVREPPARRRRVLIGALVGSLVVVAGGVFAVVKLTQHHDPTVTAGPLSGTYRADFGPLMGLDETSNPGTKPELTNTYGVRSVCRSTGCVATAARVGGPPVATPTMVLDQVGGGWVSVVLDSDQCRSRTSEWWHVLTLRPRPDGTLTGVYTMTSSNVCLDTRTVTFTRTGDVDVGSVPDPAGQPPRALSPAEALHGHYHSTRTFTNTHKLPELQTDYTVTTDCLRTGDRCMSYFHESQSDIPLVFAGGKWSWDVVGDGMCGGAITHLTDTGQYPLPEPLQNPITRLTGRGHHEQGAPCAHSGDFNQTFTRTGD